MSTQRSTTSPLPVADQPSATGFRVSMRCFWELDDEGRLACRWREELVLQPVEPRP